MGKKYNQKLKILYLLDLLVERTDEEHGISMPDILEELNGMEIPCERRSIYSDISLLTEYGYDIDFDKSCGYRLLNHKFEIAELKLLVDAIQASKFITAKKSNELIKKLESFTSTYEAKQLQRQVIVGGRVKTMNESIYYNVDAIHDAIYQNRQISFQYTEWSIDKKLIPKKNGELYRTSPWSLCFENENYYLIAYDTEKKFMKHYRVDKMKNIRITSDKCEGKKAFDLFDTGVYANKRFGMFGGEEVVVEIECSRGLVGVVIDRFGKDVPIRINDENTFIFRKEVAISQPFFGWLSSFGTDMKIISPKEVVNQYSEYVREIISSY